MLHSHATAIAADEPSHIDPALAEEARAVRTVLQGHLWPRLRLAAGALVRLAKDHDDTRQVFILSVALNASRMPDLAARFLADDRGLDLLVRRAGIDSRAVDYAALRRLPADTLGGAYVRFLDENRLDPDLFQAPPGLPAVAAYIAQRLRQTHDIWHVVTGYTPDVPGELSLLAFTYAQTRMPSLGLLAAFGVVRFELRERGLFRRVVRGYRRGKRAPFLATVHWEEMWDRPLAEVQEELAA